MELGVGTIDQEESSRKMKLSSEINKSRGTGGGGKNPGGGGSNDNNDPFSSELLEADDQRPDKFKVLMWFTLLVVLMTFSGLIAAYVVVATNGVIEWRPFNLPIPVWISTALIIASSITYEIFRNHQNTGNQKKAKNWLMITCAFGSAFISSQLLAWVQLVGMGVYMRSNPYAGFFYIITAVHAAHVIGGISGLIYLVYQIWDETDSDAQIARRKMFTASMGWYWHLMGALWVILFVLLGFWK